MSYWILRSKATTNENDLDADSLPPMLLGGAIKRCTDDAGDGITECLRLFL